VRTWIDLSGILLKKKVFTVKSMYKKLTLAWTNMNFKNLWKAKVPPKFKIWLWFIWHNAIATKNNMKKRGWTGNTKCIFCEEERGYTSLIFFYAPAAKYM
jgi:hypothetical protein